MKKAISFRGLLTAGMVVVAALLSSCSRSAYKKAIPADAPIVVELDIKKAGLKSDFLSQKDEIADLILASSPDDRTARKIADAVRDPQSMGLDLLSPMYVFVSPDVEDAYFLASVRKPEDLIKKLRSFSDGIEISESGKINWLTVNGQIAGAVTEKALLIGSANNKTAFRDLLENNKAFFSTDAGKYFAKHTGDLSATVNMEALSRQARNEIRREVGRELRDLRPYLTDDVWEQIFEQQWVANLDFKSGECALNLFIEGVEKDDAKVLSRKVSKDALRQIPERNLVGLVAAGIEGQKYIEAADEAIEESGSRLAGEEKMIYNLVKQILRKTDGTMAAAVLGKNFSEDPDLLFLVPTPYEEIEPVLEIIGDEMPKDLFVDGDKKSVSVTNIRNYRHGEVQQPFAKASDAASSYLYAYLDAEPVVDLCFRDLERHAGHDEARLYSAFRNLCNLADCAELLVEKKDAATLRLELNDDSRNSLALILAHAIRIGNAYIDYGQARRERYDAGYNYYDYDD